MRDTEIMKLSDKLSELAKHLDDLQIFFEGCKTAVSAAALIRDALTKRLRWLYDAQKQEEYQRFATEIQTAIDHLNRQRAIADALHALGNIPQQPKTEQP